MSATKPNPTIVLDWNTSAEWRKHFQDAREFRDLWKNIGDGQITRDAWRMLSPTAQLLCKLSASFEANVVALVAIPDPQTEEVRG